MTSINNVNLTHRQQNPNDEYYTQLIDVTEGLAPFKKRFQHKTIYCNCDDPHISNFFKYFLDNFHLLKLKRLICTGMTKNGGGGS